MRFTTLPLIAASIVCQTFAAVAETSVVPKMEPLAAPALQDTDEWKFTLGMPGWLAGLEGDVGVRGLQPIYTDVPFSKILDNLDMVATLSFEAQKGPWSFYAEGPVRLPLAAAVHRRPCGGQQA